MAIARMAKIVIITHNTQTRELLEALQSEGTCQILNAEEAMVSRDWPELAGGIERPRDLEQLLIRVEKSVAFLKDYAAPQKGLASMLAPRAVIDERQYKKTISDKAALKIVDRCEQIESAMDKLDSKCENLNTTLDMLGPWEDLETPVEELGQLTQATAIAGLIPAQYFTQTQQELAELGAAIQQIAATNNKYACLVVCMKETTTDIQKLLRSADFEQVHFEHMTGTAAELIEHNRSQLNDATKQLQQEKDDARAQAKDFLKLQILFDHHRNLLDREQTRTAAPATECTVVLEGWVRNKDFSKLEKTVGKFDASSLSKIEPAEDEEIPVEIENNNAVRPFESITRLYGMPSSINVDPTVFLAPFFAIFFGLCLTDAGYGIILVGILWYMLKKIQGDAKFVWMLLICSVMAIFAGIITGGWFGDAVQVFLPQADNLRKSLMLFDPMAQPMVFFGISLGLGYIQIMFGLFIALFHNIFRKDYIAAICDQLTWLIMLNSLVLFGLSKGGIIPGGLSILFGLAALICGIIILLFSEREGGWGGRISMGVFSLFCTVFYVGDVLSYVRIMALGMVTGGFGLAINIIVKLLADVPHIGWLLGAIVFVGGHLFNIALSVLGSFVHSMRLQFVEFFPKFFVGGGKQFEPLARKYKYIDL